MVDTFSTLRFRRKTSKIFVENVLTFGNVRGIIHTESEVKIMKIFIANNCPTAHFYYKVLRFLLEHACRSEIDFYLDQLEGK